MNALMHLANPFTFGSVGIRTAIGPDGQVWFAARDVCDALDIAWKGVSGSLRSIPDHWQGVCYLQTPGGIQQAVFVTESAVYKLAFRSNKPEAERFTDWVCGEVLPAIRRQGYYGRLSARERLACSRQIGALVERLVRTRDALARTVLLHELRDLCNAVGHPLPDVSLLGRDPDQMALPFGSQEVRRG